MKESIRNAYERMTPDEYTRDALLQRIQMQTRTLNAKIHSPWKRPLTAAACAVLIVALSALSSTVYQKWNFAKSAQSSRNTAAATRADAVGDNNAASDRNPAAALTDEVFIQKAVKILQILNMEDTAKAPSYVMHDWEYADAEVYFNENANVACIKFHEQTGEFLGMSCMDWDLDGTVCTTYEEAEKLAEQYYEILPVPQGYVLREHYKMNGERWDFRFWREVQEDVYSMYEAVSISVNPQTGRLIQCMVHSVPLLDDHEPEDVPITAEEAEKLARACLKNTKNYQTAGCELEVVQPVIPEPQDFTRLSWCLSFENPSSDYEDRVTICVDYYTGEILLMGSTQ